MIIYATGGAAGATAGGAAATTCIFAPVLGRAAAFSVAVRSHCRRWALGWFPHGAAAGWALLCWAGQLHSPLLSGPIAGGGHLVGSHTAQLQVGHSCAGQGSCILRCCRVPLQAVGT